MSVHPLTTLLGRRAVIEGRRVTIIEILTQDECIVLREEDGEAFIQADQFGSAVRRTASVWTVPVRSEVNRGELHPIVAAFLAGAEDDALRAWMRAAI